VANSKVFCNTPWYELHIYWDGSLGICCRESQKLYDDDQTQYNIANMTIAEWFNSHPVRQFRQQMLDSTPSKFCTKCYQEESSGNTSRRFRSNQKSIIFTRTAFDQSWKQSPGNHYFEHSAQHDGFTSSSPIDLHIDLGNFCNMACKMCCATDSSTIASQEVKWGIESSRKYLGTDWTKDEQVWASFKQQLLEIPKLKNIHFMGGETLLTDRLEDLADWLIAHKRFDVCISFVTNGSKFKPELIKKLTKFPRVGIEISIENLDVRNDYIRQGFSTQQILKNISQYQELCNGSSVSLALRPAPSLLSVGGFEKLLRYALHNQFVVKSGFVSEPKFLDIKILPEHIKKFYLSRFQTFLDELNDVDADVDYNASDPNNLKLIIKEQVIQCISTLTAETPPDSDDLLRQMVDHCKKWDNVYQHNARVLYPEFEEIWNKYGY
jgi:hypothetical protein